MTSNPDPPPERQAREREDDDQDKEEDEDNASAPTAEITQQQQTNNLPERKKTLPGAPAYVSPIPKIGSIPQVSAGIQFSPPGRPKLPPFVGSFLMGKPVDEYGDVVDDKTGQVLARAGGDLPSIVGRKVSNRQGDILGDDGELLGYVADIEIEKKNKTRSDGSPPGSPSQPRSLFEIMGRSNASLMVDHLGNILDASGNVVGKFHDNNNPLHRKEKEEREEKEKAAQSSSLPPPVPTSSPPPPPPQQQQQQQPETEQGEAGGKEQKRPRRTEEERRENAQAWRKENPGESPSDIFLDVKSTTEGIQLTIRIPTVFGGQQVKPNITFS
ncbi:hypothetical protein B0T17DRAFT_591472 [Bombardia bombarda]|uniref:Uncharacterized protein n=1 Tax=Bombardia bombarda TaxID=252184 RepID=A0AA40C185_9PEZI|nr:hypothetical protein B0T17DRAFT_591472 [Bombardia bombarda]